MKGKQDLKSPFLQHRWYNLASSLLPSPSGTHQGSSPFMSSLSVSKDYDFLYGLTDSKAKPERLREEYQQNALWNT